MRDSWRPFSTAETDAIPPGPLTDTAERECPACGERGIRVCYRELERIPPLGPIRFTCFWCSRCHRHAHFRGALRSPSFRFDDPLAALTEDDLGEARPSNWYTRLDDAWAAGVLPQRFVVRRS